ncbi:uncharacterized protein LOC108411749 isoform X2 [Pygocentrus nattereri]|uniref:uncharacterized protein LOC108411749 isoform X2 n=1 Tax=Pygocentrus nattereri TaxID=42514 RepID=UPI001891877E|nr:uncharacterized protein LOC108411749 isoform X2 [Pygocentrus nattereri]
MLLTFYLLFIGLCVTQGCTLVEMSETLPMIGHTGGSVLLPCYCTDLHTGPGTFSWNHHTNKGTWENILSESGQYRDRVQLVNGHSPGNLSLFISPLTEEDRGDYQCLVQGSGYIYFKLTVKGQRQGQIERGEQRGTKREQETEDDVTYFTVAHSNTTSLPTIPDAGDKTEYATIRVN